MMRLPTYRELVEMTDGELNHAEQALQDSLKLVGLAKKAKSRGVRNEPGNKHDAAGSTINSG